MRGRLWAKTVGFAWILSSTAGYAGTDFGRVAQLTSSAAIDGTATDTYVATVTNGAGTWIATWASSDVAAGVTPGTSMAVVSRSIDDGTTWSAPSVVRSEFVNLHGARPAVATDTHGVWAIAWGDLSDVYVSFSTDSGETWGPPSTLVSGGVNVGPSIATDGSGTWIVAWDSVNNIGGADQDILYARSSDQGETWSAPAFLNTTGASDV